MKPQPTGKKPFDPDILTYGSLLPSDEDAERRLLGSLLYNPVYVTDVRVPLGEGEVFYNAEHLIVYQTILAIYDRGENVSYPNLTVELRRTGQSSIIADAALPELLNYSESLSTLSHIAFYLREMWMQRDMFMQAGKLLASVRDRAPFAEQLDLLHSLSDQVSSRMTLANQRNLAYYARQTLMGIQAAAEAKDGLVGITTGLRKLNKITGGWQRQRLYYVGGRPGAGKSALMLSFALAAAKESVPVCFKSTEMSVEQMLQRLVASEVGIPYQDLANGKHDNGTPFSTDEWQQIHQTFGYIETLPIHFYDGPAHDIHDFVRWVKDKIQRAGVRLAFCDYVQSMTNRFMAKADKVQVVASVSQELKSLTNLSNIPVVAGAQLGRQVDERKNRRPLLADFKESGQIEQDADMAIGLYRNDYYLLQDAKAKSKNGVFDEPDYDHQIEVDLVKYRHGKLGRARLGCNIGCNIFTDTITTLPPLPPVPHKEKAADKWVNKFPVGAARNFSESDRETLNAFEQRDDDDDDDSKEENTPF